jgi:hypothetical protein
MSLNFGAGAVSGFGVIDQLNPDQLPAKSSAIVRNRKLISGKRCRLQIEVIQNGERISLKSKLDGKVLTTWQGNAQLSCAGLQAIPCLQAIGVVVSQSAAEIHQLELRVKGDANAYRLGNDWKNPISATAAGPPQEIAAKCSTWKGRRYFISDDIMSVSSAQKLAAKWRGRLLTISSTEEEAFIYEEGRSRNAAYMWTSSWRHEGSKEWRDERNRPIRFSPTWAPGQPNFGLRELVLMYQNAMDEQKRGIHDAGLYDNAHACIEWGNEYPEEE